MTPEQINRNAATVRNAGLPDFLNRWLSMTPEKWQQHRSAIDHLNAQTRGEFTVQIGPKEQALRDTRKKGEAAAPAAQLVRAKPTAKEESDMSTKKPAAKSVARTSVKGKTKAAKSEGPKPGSKLAIIHGMLRRPEGCTTKQVLEACAWPAVSMPQQARALGIKLKKEKVDGLTVYRAA